MDTLVETISSNFNKQTLISTEFSLQLTKSIITLANLAPLAYDLTISRLNFLIINFHGALAKTNFAPHQCFPGSGSSQLSAYDLLVITQRANLLPHFFTQVTFDTPGRRFLMFEFELLIRVPLL